MSNHFQVKFSPDHPCWMRGMSRGTVGASGPLWGSFPRSWQLGLTFFLQLPPWTNVTIFWPSKKVNKQNAWASHETVATTYASALARPHAPLGSHCSVCALSSGCYWCSCLSPPVIILPRNASGLDHTYWKRPLKAWVSSALGLNAAVLVTMEQSSSLYFDFSQNWVRGTHWDWQCWRLFLPLSTHRLQWGLGSTDCFLLTSWCGFPLSALPP